MTDHESRRAPHGGDDADQAAFAARVAAPLRAPETLDPSFELRVMAAARSEAPALYPSARGARSWWLRPLALRLSPLGALALAAAFAGIVSLATPRAANDAPGAQVVRFVLVDAGAKQVSLVGDFNGWRADATPLQATAADGVWTVSVPLAAGRHEYAFIVDGTRWVADPFAPKRTDEFQTESSIVTVGM